MAQTVKNLLQRGRSGFNLWIGKIPWRKEQLPTPVSWPGEFHGLYGPWGRKESDTTDFHSHTQDLMGLPGGSVVKNPPANNAGDAGDAVGSVPGPG